MTLQFEVARYRSAVVVEVLGGVDISNDVFSQGSATDRETSGTRYRLSRIRENGSIEIRATRDAAREVMVAQPAQVARCMVRTPCRAQPEGRLDVNHITDSRMATVHPSFGSSRRTKVANVSCNVLLVVGALAACSDSGGATGVNDVDGGPSRGDGGAMGIFEAQACTPEFCWEYPQPIGTKMLGLSVLRDDRILAVGEGGAVLQKSDGEWGVATLPDSQTLRAAWAQRDDNVWAVGSAGTIAHYDGKSLTIVPSGTTDDLSAIWGVDEKHIWAVGMGGVILAFDGNAWKVASEAGDELHAVWGTSANNVWAVGGRYNVSLWSHWDGTAWSTVRGGISNGALFAVAGSDADNVWAVGEYSRLYRWVDGTFALTGSFPSNSVRLRALEVTPSGVTAWGDYTSFGYDGKTWTEGAKIGATAVSRAPNSSILWRLTPEGGIKRSDSDDAQVMTGNVSSAHVLSSGQGFVVLQDRSILRRDDTNWTRIGRTFEAPVLEFDTTAFGETTDGVVLIASRVGGANGNVKLQAYDGTQIRELTSPPMQVTDAFQVGGRNLADIWLQTSDIGSWWHLSGTNWSAQEPDIAASAFDAIHGDAVWFVGDDNKNAAATTFMNGVFTPRPIPNQKNVRLKTVVAKGREAWAGGVFSDFDNLTTEGGFNIWPKALRLFHFDGSKWEVLPLPPSASKASLHGVEDVRVALSPAGALIVGVSGGIDVTNNVFSFDGTSWTEKRCPVPGIGLVVPTAKELWIGSSEGIGGSVNKISRGLLRERH